MVWLCGLCAQQVKKKTDATVLHFLFLYLSNPPFDHRERRHVGVVWCCGGGSFTCWLFPSSHLRTTPFHLDRSRTIIALLLMCLLFSSLCPMLLDTSSSQLHCFSTYSLISHHTGQPCFLVLARTAPLLSPPPSLVVPTHNHTHTLYMCVLE